jgi:hypothetical protein
MFLYEVTDLLQKERVAFAIVGGYGLALHGLVRATMDIDLLLHLKLRDFEKVEACFQSIGLQSRLPLRAKEIISMRQEYIERRNLIAWSFVDYNRPTRQVDVIIDKDLKDIKVELIVTAGRKLPVATLESLLEMKQSADRPQDRIDVERIKERLNAKKGK